MTSPIAQIPLRRLPRNLMEFGLKGTSRVCRGLVADVTGKSAQWNLANISCSDVSTDAIRLNLYNASRRRRRLGTIQCDVRGAASGCSARDCLWLHLTHSRRPSAAQLIYAKHLIAFDAALTKWQASMPTRGNGQWQRRCNAIDTVTNAHFFHFFLSWLLLLFLLRGSAPPTSWRSIYTCRNSLLASRQPIFKLQPHFYLRLARPIRR